MIEALVVNVRRRGPHQMAGIDAPGEEILNAVTGGEYTRIQGQLQKLETLLTASIVASCLAGAFALGALLKGR